MQLLCGQAVTPVQAAPHVGLRHPRGGSFYNLPDYQAWYRPGDRPAVGLILHRRWVAGGNTAHFAAVIERLEARGLAVYACYSDLDAAPLIDHFFAPAGVQCLLNLISFNLIGGHGRPDPQRAAALLERFDRPYLCAVPLVMQTIELWRASRMGLAPHQAVMQVAMPELEGGASAADPAQADRMAARVKRWVDQRLRAEGYTIDLRESADALRRAVLGADTALPGPARGAWSSSR